VCGRRGEVERKRRSDAGKSITPEKRTAFREKLTMVQTTTPAMTIATAPPDEVTTAMDTTAAGAADDVDNNNIALNTAMHDDTEMTLEEHQDTASV
jgi:hypothetical protein